MSFVSCWTELVKMPYETQLVSGGTFRGQRIVAAVNHCSDGTKTYFDSAHKSISRDQFEKIKETLEYRKAE